MVGIYSILVSSSVCPPVDHAEWHPTFGESEPEVHTDGSYENQGWFVSVSLCVCNGISFMYISITYILIYM